MTVKAQLRNQLLLWRKQMTEGQQQEYSARIWQKLFQLPHYQKAQRIFSYVHLPGEVQTLSYIQATLQEKEWYVPKIDKNRMRLVRLRGVAALESGYFGVLEPVGHEFYEGNVEVVITPGLAFDPQGNRIGYGKGYYDRFFAEQRHDVAIGVCFERFVQAQIPTDQYDQKVDIVITEQRCMNKSNISL